MKDLNANKKKNRFFIKGLVFILPVFLTCWIISKIIIFMSTIIPSNFLDIIPGSSETYLGPDDIIYDTTDAVSFTDLLGKVVFSKE